RQKRKQPDESSGESDTGGEEKSKQNVGACTTAPIAVLSVSSGSSLPSVSAVQDQTYLDNDVGHWLGRSFSMTSSQKMEVLKNCWSPTPSYDFAKDAVQLKRKFKYSWLVDYAPWLAYSMKVKGALCIYCVLFPPTKVHGVLRSFIFRPFTRSKDMHEFAKSHASSQWHKSATTAAKCFVENIPVDVQLISVHQQEIEANKEIVASIISTVMFCGTHDPPFRGKGNHEGVYEDFIKLKIGAENMMVREEFLGFVELSDMNAKSVASAINNFIEKVGLDPEKCVGQGYDGCSTMAGKDGGVQSILRKTYTRALYFHCAIHKLNLEVNDLNEISAIQNTVSTIKEIIRFFRESDLSRKCIPNMLRETRWSQKHKSIATFKGIMWKSVWGLKHYQEEQTATMQREKLLSKCIALLQNLNSLLVFVL
ncbi:hypothetical protein J437_LFUL011338, partial [Ladona fulva]